MIQLFEIYPLLRRLPYKSFYELPTPVHRLESLGKKLGLTNLFVKRDDISGTEYGGNKPRKLEFILGKALDKGARSVMTLGGVGSNHALATAIYAKKLGLKSISMLMPQPNANYVRRNLLLSCHYNAELHLCGTGLGAAFNMPLVRLAIKREQLRHRLLQGYSPYFIPPGGSSALGAIGFVNAALELKEQILNGEIPEPEYIYVACGTMGTAAGLILGLKAAGLNSRIIPIRVTSEKLVNRDKMIGLITKTNDLLHSVDNSFPELNFSGEEIDIRHGFFGEGYAIFTREGMKAVSLMEEFEGIKLEGTYTGKALAALLDDVKSSKLNNEVVLFWNTVNSADYSVLISTLDYRKIPRPFHRYFEEEVQPLDKNY